MGKGRGKLMMGAGQRTTKIIFCGCPQQYQNKRYGAQMRVHNRTQNGWRCTGCGRDTS